METFQSPVNDGSLSDVRHHLPLSPLFLFPLHQLLGSPTSLDITTPGHLGESVLVSIIHQQDLRDTRLRHRRSRDSLTISDSHCECDSGMNIFCCLSQVPGFMIVVEVLDLQSVIWCWKWF